MPVGIPYRDCETTSALDASVVVRESSASQFARHQQLVISVWAGPVSPEVDAHDRERSLKSPWYQGTKHFSLVPRDDPETSQIIGGCSLIPLRILERLAGEVEPREVDGYLLEWLVIDLPHRGRSYSLRLLNELTQKALDLETRYVIGWSEMGTSVYDKIGSSAFEAQEVYIPVDDYANMLEPEEVHLMTLDDVYENVPNDQLAAIARLKAHPANKNCFAVLPTIEQYSAKFDRVLDRLAYLKGKERVPEHFACRIDSQSFCIWNHNTVESRLYFLRFVADGAENARKLLIAAAQEAAYWGLRACIAWDFDPTLARELGLSVCTRDDDLPICFTQMPSTWLCRERYAGFVGGT